MEQSEKRFVGIDLAKRSYVAHIAFSGTDKGRVIQGRTDSSGLRKLYRLLDSDDLVSIECTAQATWLTRQIMDKVGCQVYLLNAGDLAIIYRSTKKTDLNDAEKLSWILKRMPPAELPIVPLPSQIEEERRIMVSELHSKKKIRTKLINRVHSIFAREGITGLQRSHLKTIDDREKCIGRLKSRSVVEVRRLYEEINLVEKHISEIDAEMSQSLLGDEKAENLFSMPGVGQGLAMAFLAYIGDGSRFSKARQVSNYVGMTPRVYASGETSRIGHISKRGCRAIRSIIVQAAWSAVHSKKSNVFKTKYQELVPRIGKKKAIVAIARRMLETMWVLVTRNERFRGWDELSLRLKMSKIRCNAGKTGLAA